MSKQLVRKVAHRFGVLSIARYVSRNGLRILTYHRFGPDTSHLARQCEHIRRHYHPISLREVADRCEAGGTWPVNALAVTIDDGYRDYASYAHPVFRKYEVPTTVFVVSDFVDGRVWIWTRLVDFLVTRTPRSSLTLAAGQGAPREFSLETTGERLAAALAVKELLKEADNTDRQRALDALVRTLDVDVPAIPPPEDAPLSWNDIQRLADEGVEIGAHTRTHPILSRVNDPRQLEQEILGSKSRIESVLRRPVIHFCYPNGRTSDAAVRMVERGGFRTAVTTERGINFAGAPRFLLRRVGVEPDNPMLYFQELLSGIRAE